MSGTTTAFPTSSKQEYLQAMHCHTATVNFTANTNSSNSLTSVSSQANLCRGMPLNPGGDIPALCYIVDLPTGSTATIYPAATGTHTTQSLSATGDAFNVALIKNGCAGTYGAASTNYSNITGNSDEVSGTGYTAGGLVLSNTTPSISGTTGFTTPAVNPSWTSATIDTQGCMIYNNTTRAGAAGRAVYVGDFGGEVKGTNATITLVMPTNNSSSALLRIA